MDPEAKGTVAILLAFVLLVLSFLGLYVGGCFATKYFEAHITVPAYTKAIIKVLHEVLQ